MNYGILTGVRKDISKNSKDLPWVDFSFNSTITGWSTFTTRIIRYQVLGRTVRVYFNLSGTSNSATTSFTLPIPSAQFTSTSNTIRGVDNGVNNLCDLELPSLSQIVTFSRWSAITTRTSTWTASGTKTVIGQFFYEI